MTKQGVDLQPSQNTAVRYFAGIVLDNLYIHDIAGQGISLNYIHKDTYNSKLRGCIVQNCQIEVTTQNGIVVDGGINTSFIDNNMDMIGQNGFRLDKSNDIIIKGNTVNRPGRITPAGDGGYVLGCNNVLIEKNTFKNARGDLDATGFHIDVNNRNVIVQYNLSRAC